MIPQRGLPRKPLLFVAHLHEAHLQGRPRLLRGPHRVDAPRDRDNRCHHLRLDCEKAKPEPRPLGRGAERGVLGVGGAITQPEGRMAGGVQRAGAPRLQQARAHEEVARHVDEHHVIARVVGCGLDLDHAARQAPADHDLGAAVEKGDGHIISEEQQAYHELGRPWGDASLVAEMIREEQEERHKDQHGDHNPDLMRGCAPAIEPRDEDQRSRRRRGGEHEPEQDGAHAVLQDPPLVPLRRRCARPLCGVQVLQQHVTWHLVIKCRGDTRGRRLEGGGGVVTLVPSRHGVR